MSIIPLITFKAGLCEVDASSKPLKVKPQPTPGYIYLYSEDDLTHFCWRDRSAPMDNPELDLVMVPTDGHFKPYEHNSSDQPAARTNGRIFVLKFSSSSQRHLFWLQSKPQSRSGDASWFSPRDLKIGEIVDKILQGEDVDVTRELAQVRRGGNDGGDDEDETMEDFDVTNEPHNQGGSGGAGADATGGDVREEGESAREGGSDGARAASTSVPDAATAVRNFLDSLKGKGDMGRQAAVADKPWPFLTHLLPSTITIPMVEAAPEAYLDSLLGFLPPTVVLLVNASDDLEMPTEEAATREAAAARSRLNVDQKRSLLKKVLRSPQFHQALGSLTMALRDGGLPTVADALGIQVENGGFMKGGTVALGGGEAVEAFIQGVKRTVADEEKSS